MAGILDIIARRSALTPGTYDNSQYPAASGILAGAVRAPQITPFDPSSMPIPNPSYGDWWSTHNPDGTSSFLGGLLTYDPKKDQGSAANGGNRLGMIGATLEDVGSSLGGQPQLATHLRQQLADQISQQQKQLQAAAVQRLMSAQTPQERQAAALALYQSGGDLSGLNDAIKMGQPQYMDAGENGKIALDPFTGLPVAKIAGTPKPPQTRQIQRGSNVVSQQFNPQTGMWEDIPGAVGPRFAPRAEKTPSPTAPIVIPHPGSMY